MGLKEWKEKMGGKTREFIDNRREEWKENQSKKAAERKAYDESYQAARIPALRRKAAFDARRDVAARKSNSGFSFGGLGARMGSASEKFELEGKNFMGGFGKAPGLPPWERGFGFGSQQPARHARTRHKTHRKSSRSGNSSKAIIIKIQK